MDDSLHINSISTGKSDADHPPAMEPVSGHPHVNGTLPSQSLQMTSNGDLPATQKSGRNPWPLKSNPVAITGMAMKLPGGVRTAEGFWDFLIQGKDGHCQVPATRYNMSAHHSTTRPDLVRTAGGYFLQDDPAKFDAEFFRLRPQLVAGLDPQQRLLLEVVWECIENAGETNLAGKNVGCFVGAFGNDWMELSVQDRQDYDRNHVACNHDFTLANQISRLFDFTGPSVTYRTACSSSMTALHHACQAVDSGECEMAVVAGVNLILTPTTSTSMSAYGAISPSGLCKTFDASADGYGRGEAVNAIFIKRLEAAMQGEDPVRAVIRATGINSDGNSPMVGVPRPETQERLIRTVYEKAAIGDFSQTAFFECHGTGTQKGDVIETSVIAKIFKNGLLMGSVKPNMGHSEGAAGLTSVIKAVLALEHRLIPPNIHFHHPNPKIAFEKDGLRVPRELTPWPDGCAERVSVNCFGVGGSNAHVILDSASSIGAIRPRINGVSVSQGYKLLPISASSEESLKWREVQIREYLENHPDALLDLSYTLGARRDHLCSRGFLIASDKSIIQAHQVHLPCVSTCREVTFVFPGQGAQWPAMGKQLLNQFDHFRNDVKKMDEVLQSLTDPPRWRIEGVLSDASDSWIEDAELAQPLCTAVQIGLVNLLCHWSVRPDSVAGHSSGEIAAAYAAGAISLRSAIILSYYRGTATKLQSESGYMAAVGMGKSYVLPYLTKGVTVACENSPRNVTLSGESDKLDDVMQNIASDHPTCLCKRLPVGVAYHSDSMAKSARQYAKMVGPYLDPNESMVPMFSCVTGQDISSPKELDTTYWRRTIESPVLFHQSINSLLQSSQTGRVIVEVGPQSLLSGPLNQIFEASEQKSLVAYIPTLLKDKDPMECLLSTAGGLYQQHVPLDFVAINGPGKALTDLPLYPWQHNKRYWYDTRIAREWKHAQFAPHPLLGYRSPESSAVEPSWRNRLQIKHVPWLSDHKIGNDIVYPCVGYISMVGEGIRQITGSTSFSVRELFITAVLNLKEGSPIEIVTNIRPHRLTDSVDSLWYDFTISAWDGKNWQKHCSGQAKAGKDIKWDNYPESKDFVPGTRDVQSNLWFDSLEALGLGLGPSFRRLEDITVDPTNYYAAARVRTRNQSKADDGHCIHPAVIDQGLQLLGVASCNGLPRRMSSIGIPVYIDSIYISDATEMISLQAVFLKSESGSLRSALGGSVMGRSNGGVAFALEGVRFIPLNKPKVSTGAKIPLGSRLDWKPDIDLLAGKDYLFKSIQHTSFMEVVAKLTIVIVLDFVDRMGFSCSASALDSKQSQPWIQDNYDRLRNVMMCFFPDIVDGFRDPVSLHSKLICDLEAATESSESWIQPIRGYLTKVLDALDDQVSLTELFMDHSGFKSLYEFTATSVDLGYTFSLLGHANPTMTILEINPGTCGTTSGALAALKSEEGTSLFSRYTFASQSSDLLTEANEQFGNIDGFSTAVLDPKLPISAQRFKLKSYDLVIVPSNLPKLFDSAILMQDVKSLLTPGGRVLVREVTPPVPIIDYFMGMMPAPFTLPHDLHLPIPFPSEFWESELLAAGFMQPEHHSGSMSMYPWSMKQAILAKNTLQEPPKDSIYLLCPPESHPWVDIVRSNFESEGYKIYLTTLENLSKEITPLEKGNFISLLDLNSPFFADLSAEKYNDFLKYMTGKRRTLWVSRPSQMQCDDPSSGLITGFARTVRLEALVEFATFEVDKFDKCAAGALVKVYEKIRRESLQNRWDPECEFVLQNGVVHIGRFYWLPFEQLTPPMAEDNPMSLAVERPGSRDSIAWKQQQLPDLGNDDVELDVHYAGMNFRDIMVALGAIDGERGLGLEASGVVRRVGAEVTHLQPGNRVTALGTGLYTSRLVISSKMCFPIASDISMEDAATIPVAYATAIYSLLTVGQLERGQSVLIHSACGAVGQAAIHIARTMKAKIYTTVGTSQKVEYLEETFGIPRENIFHSRDTSFASEVMSATGGKGVDIVLNSLSGELLHASWNCVAKFGKMVEIGKRDFMGHGTMKMEPFGGNRTFVGVDLLQVMLESPARFQRLCDIFTRLSIRGKIQPIRPVKIFDASDAREGFAYMQRGIHMGKILIRFTAENAVTNIPKAITIAPTVSFRPNASYLIVGGLGGIGRAVANWLVENGARHLVFLSRSGARSPKDQAFLQELRSQGCQPIAIAGSVTNMDHVKCAVTASPMPISGLIHLGMVLKPAPLLEASYDDWMAVQDPKVKGSWNLHCALGSAKLDFFVVMSSIAAVCGSIGQASYASANSYLGSLVRFRRSLGLPAATLDLGAVGDIGCFSQEPKWLAQARQWEFQLLDEGQVIEALQTTICASQAPYGNNGTSASGQIIVGMGTTRTDPDVTQRIPWRDARYRIFANIGLEGQNTTVDSIFELTRQYLVQAQQNPALLEQPQSYNIFLEYIGHHMNFKVGNETERAQVARTSIDSIVMIETVGHFRRNFGVEIRLTSLVGATNIGELIRLILAELSQKAKESE
ncbi:type I iterative polyketide synthase [Penicillium argentinense]|uniref:Type I iterative polyketide synthase n=1 Tax=Penicillium argentinense TaxID=1131581 RepID=A0A9W9FD14_9EURO|nr:type I iterative polyketide synthase [Penicillium argentinense]KAJ5097819.1 type I iterative polyketide synthase [Penicillium argentinense]